MRILILTIGTRGDVQPYVALAKGLIEAGHEVTICTCQRFESFVCSHGIEYAYLNNDLLDFMDTDDGRMAMENTSNLLEAMRTGIKLFPKVTQMLHRQVAEMWDACQSQQPELILFHKKAIGAEDFAESLEIPCALAFYLPLYVPTRAFPAMGFPRWRIGGWYNRFTYRMIDWITRVSTTKFIKPWRAAQGMGVRRLSRSRSSRRNPLPVLHAYSPSVIPRPEDWPSTATVTGYWFLDNPTPDWTPPAELLQFMESGSTPIYVGFGSIFGRNPARTTKIVIEAVQRAGVRAIIATGWGGLDVRPFELPDTIHAIESAPHDWLFPRVSAVVHHGGCGTTAAGLRAGKPSVLCPFFGDQPFWSATVEHIGAGPRAIPQKRLTSERLCRAILQAVNDTQTKTTASEIGRRIRSESGVTRAVEFIEQHLAPRR